MENFLRSFTFITVLIFISINLLLGYWGIASIGLTITIYYLILIFGLFIIKKTFRNAERISNYRLLFTSIIVSLFVGELALKYVFKTHLGKQEIDKGFSIPRHMVVIK